MLSGTLAINWVYFVGTETSGSHATYGGCIYVVNGKVTIKESTFEGFSASYGGAMCVYKTSTPMTIESTTFKNNEATVRFIYRFAFIKIIIFNRLFYFEYLFLSLSYFFL